MATMYVTDPTACGTSVRPGMCFRSKCYAPSPILPVADTEPLSAGPVPPTFLTLASPFPTQSSFVNFSWAWPAADAGLAQLHCPLAAMPFSPLSLLSEPHTPPLQ